VVPQRYQSLNVPARLYTASLWLGDTCNVWPATHWCLLLCQTVSSMSKCTPPTAASPFARTQTPLGCSGLPVMKAAIRHETTITNICHEFPMTLITRKIYPALQKHTTVSSSPPPLVSLHLHLHLHSKSHRPVSCRKKTVQCSISPPLQVATMQIPASSRVSSGDYFLFRMVRVMQPQGVTTGRRVLCDE
jgi:hypothetical protein